jgi:hypothetical protein
MHKVRLAIAGGVLAASLALASLGGASAASCVFDAQIAAQNAAIVQLQADEAQAIAGQPAAVAARIAAVYDAQIADREAQVASLEAACN